MDNSAHLDDARDPLLIAEEWLGDGRAVAVATVVETWGSAPRGVGSKSSLCQSRSLCR